MPAHLLPTVRHAGVVLNPKKAGEFDGEIDSRTNFGVEIFALQRHLDTLSRVGTNTQQGLSAASPAAPAAIGFDPAP